jgi:hypothetical protein
MNARLTAPRLLRLVLSVGALTCAGKLALAGDTRVAFDIPDRIECRDVTPEKCAAAHPHLKVIEAKFRISASFIEGSEESVVDFVYMITSPEMRMEIQDYLPNTTLESTLAGDQIEVSDTTENNATASEDAHVAYRVLTLGGTKSESSKKTEADKYKRIVSKALVLASGTTNREHGVFFKLRPSKGASLEGGKEFTFLAIVPKSWRGDWCNVVCAARATKKSFYSTKVTIGGVEQAHVGLYLTGDREASDLADALCRVQEANGGVLSKQLAKEAAHLVESMHAVATPHHALAHYDEWLHNVGRLPFTSHSTDHTLAEAQAAIEETQAKLSRLSGVETKPVP